MQKFNKPTLDGLLCRLYFVAHNSSEELSLRCVCAAQAYGDALHRAGIFTEAHATRWHHLVEAARRHFKGETYIINPLKK